MNTESENWNDLAGMLRSEIEGYGRLFALLEQQRDHFVQNDLDGIIATTGDLTNHTDRLQGLKKEREALVSGMWERRGGPREAVTVKVLIQDSPADTGPLFEELLKEVNRLIDQSRRKLEQNQMLLHRAREINASFHRLINPESTVPQSVYARNGLSKSMGVPVSTGRYETRA